jgi:uncharacterized protein YoxC
MIGGSMNLPLFLDAVLTLALVTLVGFVISVLIRLQRTLESADRLLQHLDEQVDPISRNVIGSLERINGDLGRVGEVVRSLEEMSRRVQATMELAREAIASPLVKVAGFSAGTREAIKRFISKD